MEPVLSSTTRRRGHQHHPRNTTRRRLDPNQLTTSTTSLTIASPGPDGGPAQCGPVGVANAINSNSIESTESSPLRSPTNLKQSSPRRTHGTRSKKKLLDSQSNNNSCDNRLIVIQDERPAQCGLDDNTTQSKAKSKLRSSLSLSDNEDDLKISPGLEHAVARARGDGNSDDEVVTVEEDSEFMELSKLRCSSEQTEVQAAREARRRKRCADYPGLAFGCSIFSSDTMMKFSLIKNELQNIMGNQLKRVSIVV